MANPTTYPNHKITEIVSRFGRGMPNLRISENRTDGRISTFSPFKVGRNDLGRLPTTYPNRKITEIVSRFGRELPNLRISENRPDGRISAFFLFKVGIPIIKLPK